MDPYMAHKCPINVFFDTVAIYVTYTGPKWRHLCNINGHICPHLCNINGHICQHLCDINGT